MTPRKRNQRRLDYELIEQLVPEGARVLDLGCGDGTLLARLRERRGCQGYGIEINPELVRACIHRGVPVYHGDMLEGMTHYADDGFDVVVLSQTLQQTHNPLRVLQEMLRIGRRAIVSFPNYGYWRIRWQLLVRGRMPSSPLLPYPWYQTPDIHPCTIRDFKALCRQEGLRIVKEIYMVPPARRVGVRCANWRASLGIFVLERDGT